MLNIHQVTERELFLNI